MTEMYFDDYDFRGLFYWLNDAEDYIKQINDSMGAVS